MNINRIPLRNPGTAALTLFLLVAFSLTSCSDSSTGPPGAGGGTPATTVSFLVNGTAAISFSGTAAWPPSGSGVIAAMDSAGTTLQIAGYEQLTPLKRGASGPEPRFNFIVFEIADSSGISPGSYSLAFAMAVGLDISISDLDSLAYVGTSGFLTLSSVTSEKVAGTFGGNALRLSDFDPISVSGGTFETPYVTGLFDLDDTAQASGDFDVFADTGTTPIYTWNDGPANAVAVFRISNPGVPVWGVVTNGADSIRSGITHGMLPAGAILITNSEPVLTSGVMYQLAVSRTNGAYGYTSFVP